MLMRSAQRDLTTHPWPRLIELQNEANHAADRLKAAELTRTTDSRLLPARIREMLDVETKSWNEHIEAIDKLYTAFNSINYSKSGEALLRFGEYGLHGVIGSFIRAVELDFQQEQMLFRANLMGIGRHSLDQLHRWREAFHAERVFDPLPFKRVRKLQELFDLPPCLSRWQLSARVSPSQTHKTSETD